MDNIKLTPVSSLTEIAVEADNDYIYFDAAYEMFDIGGIPHPNKNNGEYYRLDINNTDAYSEANKNLAKCTAGGQVRITTDSKNIKIKIWLRNAITGMNHFTNRGVYGIDTYVGFGTQRKYVGAWMQTFADSPQYNEGALVLPEGTKEFLINLPLYGGVAKLYVGFEKNSGIAKPAPRSIKPIAFYGSSITQGGCVSRPANMYSHIITRNLDADNMNLGFSGSAMGEQSIAEYIGTREMSAFVMDYDYNSPSVQSLSETHYDFYKTVRNAQPQIPIIIVTHPHFAEESEMDKARKTVVRKTYDKAVSDGDKKVAFVDSEAFFPVEMRDLYAVDFLHPNDLGNYNMAMTILPVLKNML